MTKQKEKRHIMEVGRRVIRLTALKEGVSEAAVRREMELSIRGTYDLDNPYWADSPFKDAMPTPEEFIVWMEEKCRLS